MNFELEADAACRAVQELTRWHARAYVEGTILDSSSWTLLPMVPRGLGVRNYRTSLVDGEMSVQFELYSLRMPRQVLSSALFTINSENCNTFIRDSNDTRR